MARTTLVDYLQVYPFWLMDVAPIEPLALPVFTPLLGFSAITAPEVNVELTEFNEANWFYSRKVATSANAGSVTLSKASKWFDDDFFRWIFSTIRGDTGSQPGAMGGATPRRDLLLIHFLSRQPFSNPAVAGAAAASGLLGVAGASSSLTTGGSNVFGTAAGASGLAGAAAFTAAGAAGATLGPVEFAPRVPAKAWILYGCIPTRYKTGGDFDASSGEISIQELDVAVEYWDEISLGSAAAPAAFALGAAGDAGAF